MIQFNSIMEAPTSEPKPETDPKLAAPASSPAPVAASVAPGELHRPPAEDNDSKDPGKTKQNAEALLPPTPEIPKRQPKATGPSGPGGVIMATVFVMILLALLAVLVYVKSNNY